MAADKLEIVPGTLEMLVLKTLTPGPLHGYAIVRRLQERSADVVQVEEGSLYPALHRMERRGWLEAEWGLSENGRRARYYRLTRAGRAQLRARQRDWERMSLAIARILGEGGAA